MANSISSVTTGTGGIVLESVDTSGNTNIKSGTTTIVAVTSTGAAVTGTLSASGGIAKASLPTGSVLQVVSLTGAANTTTSSSTYIDTNITLSITPTSSTSKILCFYSIIADQTGASIKDAPMQLLRNSTVLILGDPYFNVLTEVQSTSSNSYLDSPATTSATTYKIQVKCNNSSSVLVYGSTYSSLTLMEIAA